MSRNLSVFLDLLRLLAALLVFVGHLCAIYSLDLPDILDHSAKEGVAVFFVLSGFVIAFVTACKEQHWRDFMRARMLRMYSVVPLAIVVLMVCHAIGSRVNPAIYGLADADGSSLAGPLYGGSPGWAEILRYLTFTNELWFDHIVMMTGAPFWSLGFEAGFYVAFAIAFYVRGPWRWILSALWLVACGPRIAAAFPLWLVGVGAWHLVRVHPRIGALAGWGLLTGLAFAVIAWRRWAGPLAVPLFEWPGFAQMATSMAYYLMLGLLVAAATVVFAACTPERSIWPPRLEQAIRYCAGASFTLYLSHVPILVLIAAIWPSSIGSLSRGLLAAFVSLCVIFVLAACGERRKGAYARLFEFVVSRFRNAR